MKVLQINNLTITNSTNNSKIIDNFSVDINEGEIIQLKGRNGAGKSTFLKMIIHDNRNNIKATGIVKFEEHIDILSLKGKNLSDFRSKIGYVPQSDDYTGHYNLTVKDILLDSIKSFSGEKVELRYFEEILLYFANLDSKQFHNFSIHSVPSKLSGGQQRVLTILSNIFCRPGAPLYIIDEPYNSIDAINKPFITKLITDFVEKYPKSSFLVVSHDEEFNLAKKMINI